MESTTAESETAGVNNPGIAPSVARNYGAADLPESRPRVGTSSDLELERAFTDPMANESTGSELGLESITPSTIAMGLTNMLWENNKDLTTSVERVWDTLDRVKNEIKDRDIELQTLGTTIHAKKDAKLRAMRRAAQKERKKIKDEALRAENTLQDVKKSIQQETLRLDDIRKETESRNIDAKSLRAIISQRKAALKEKDQTLDKLMNSIRENENSLAIVDKSVEAKRVEKGTIQADIASLKVEKDVVKTQKRDLESRNKTIQDENAFLEKKIKKLESEIAALEAKRVAIWNQNPIQNENRGT